MASLKRAIETEIEDARVDLVFVTGDIANAGKPTEYEAIKEQLIEPLRSLPALRHAKLAIVPGNHDIDCQRTTPSPWDSLGEARQAVYLQNSDAGTAARRPRAEGFLAYSEFRTGIGAFGVDPLRAVAAVENLTIDDHDFHIVTVNTSLFSDIYYRDEGRTPAPLEAIRHCLLKRDPGSTVIILGHHPVGWFTQESQQPFRTLLHQEGALYLHGHTHVVRAAFNDKGLESLGFGATYQAPLDARANAVYENMFALCVLDDSLHVRITSWDTTNGRWVRYNRLPHEFDRDSDILNGGKKLAYSAVSSKRLQPHIRLPHTTLLPRAAPISQMVTLDPFSEDDWRTTLAILGVVSNETQITAVESDGGDYRFQYSDVRGTHLIRCISALTHVLSRREIESENLRLDTEELASIDLITLGTAETDARALATKLAQKKSLRLMDNRDIATAVRTRLPRPLAQHVESAPTAFDSRVLIWHKSSLFVLMATQDHQFYVANQDGDQLPASDGTVRRIREVHSSVADAQYCRGDGSIESLSMVETGRELQFDRRLYLDRAKTEFEEIRYAPLASVGFKLPSARLADLYVPASAERSTEDGVTVLRQALDEMLDGFDGDDQIREQFRAKIAEKFSLPGQRQIGLARSFYQEHLHVLVLGDPGSGKSCFVKNEVLAYCDALLESGDWYANHTPVYVPLAEVAAALTGGEVSFIEACAAIVAKRAMPLNAGQLQTLVANGRAAFFFDGLDEVVSLGSRERIAREISNLLKTSARFGNRIVVTSRPAAIEPIDVPKELTRLQLQGLTQHEIRALAGKILAVQLSDTGRLRFNEQQADRQHELLERLVSDCTTKPGIGRLARNPLLLTLLVMIYANSGPPAAKKHRIYHEAVRTLVSVRNRVPGQRLLSESDLRNRLGSVALAIYETSIREVPSREEVVRVLTQEIAKELATETGAEAMARSFLQDVAEATGLVLLSHPDDDDSDIATSVSFMHHSFLEYFAAVGLLQSGRASELPALARVKRWREIVELAAGILADQGDASNVLLKILDSQRIEDVVSQSHLLFAFDCALAGDVPPDRVRTALVDSVSTSLRSTAGAVEPELRRQLADKLISLVETSGSSYIESVMAVGINDADSATSAAFVDVASQVWASGGVPECVLDAMLAACKRGELARQIALIRAVGRSSHFETAELRTLVIESLSASIPLKYAALEAIERSGEMVAAAWKPLVELLADPQRGVSSGAAQVLLRHAASAMIRGGEADRRILASCLRRAARSAGARDEGFIMGVDADIVDLYVSSSSVYDRELGIRLLPWMVRSERFVYERLFGRIRSAEVDPVELVWALETVRLVPDAASLATRADIQRIIELGRDHSRKDVRRAAIRACAMWIERDIARVDLVSLASDKRISVDDRHEALRVLASSTDVDDDVRELLREELHEMIDPPLRGVFGKKGSERQVRRLMRLCGDVQLVLSSELSRKVAQVVDDYRTPDLFHLEAMRLYGRSARLDNASLQKIAYWLRTERPRFDQASGTCAHDFLTRVRRNASAMQRLKDDFAGVRSALNKAWERRGTQARRYDEHLELRSLRAALLEAVEIETFITMSNELA